MAGFGMTMTFMIACSAAAGLFAGLILPRQRPGCTLMFLAAVALLFGVLRWQTAPPDTYRAANGVEFLFGPLWPCLAALAAFYAARALRALF
jgi:hypothetical protein